MEIDLLTPGPQGPGLNWREAYDPEAAYVRMDMVLCDDKSTYWCDVVGPVTGLYPPDHPEVWAVGARPGSVTAELQQLHDETEVAKAAAVAAAASSAEAAGTSTAQAGIATTERAAAEAARAGAEDAADTSTTQAGLSSGARVGSEAARDISTTKAAEAAASATLAAASGAISRETWDALVLMAPAAIGQRATVATTDAGTHTGRTASSPGSDVTGVANSGVYGGYGTGVGQWRWDGVISATGAASLAEAQAGLLTDKFVAPSVLKPALDARVGTFIVLTDEWYLDGQLVLAAEVDQDGYSPFVITADGVMRAPLPLLGEGGLIVSASPLTGFTTISADPALVPDISDEWYLDGQLVADAWCDAEYYAAMAVSDEGKVLTSTDIAQASSPAARFVVADDHLVEVAPDDEEVDQLFAYARVGGRREQITQDGPNGTPLLLADGETIIYPSLRGAEQTLYAQSLVDRQEFLAVSSPAVVGWGNSLSDSGYLTSLALLGYDVDVEGIGGQEDIHVLARMGKPFTLSVSGNQIPASGSVAVSSIVPDFWHHWNSATGAFKGVIVGALGEEVPGTFTYSSGTLAFVRDSPGTAVPVPATATGYLTSGRTVGSTTSAGRALRDLHQRTALFYPNYNSITEVGTHTTADIIARNLEMLGRLLPIVKRFLWIGDVAGMARLTAAQSGGSYVNQPATAADSKVLLDRTRTINAALQAAFPDNFIDQEASLVGAGHTSTYTVSGSDYQIVSLTILTDGVHHGDTGKTFLAGLVDTALQNLG